MAFCLFSHGFGRLLRSFAPRANLSSLCALCTRYTPDIVLLAAIGIKLNDFGPNLIIFFFYSRKEYFGRTVDPMRLDWIRQMRFVRVDNFSISAQRQTHPCSQTHTGNEIITIRVIFFQNTKRRGKRSGRRQLDKCMLKFQLAI